MISLAAYYLRPLAAPERQHQVEMAMYFALFLAGYNIVRASINAALRRRRREKLRREWVEEAEAPDFRDDPPPSDAIKR